MITDQFNWASKMAAQGKEARFGINSEFLREMKNDEPIQSAWFYNGKIFGLDQKEVRHKLIYYTMSEGR